jgi:hypothetical protein
MVPLKGGCFNIYIHRRDAKHTEGLPASGGLILFFCFAAERTESKSQQLYGALACRSEADAAIISLFVHQS